MGRNESLRLKFSPSELLPLKQMFQVVVAYGSGGLSDKILDKGESCIPAVNRSSLREFILVSRKICKPDYALNDDHRRFDWTCSSWTTYFNSFSGNSDLGMTIETLENYLFMAKAGAQAIANDTSDALWLPAIRTIIQQESYDVSPIEAKLDEAKKKEIVLSRRVEVTEAQVRAALAKRRKREIGGMEAREKAYIPLLLITDRNEQSNAEQSLEYSYLDTKKLLSSSSSFPILVALGEPGAGKTTILQHIEAEAMVPDLDANASLVPLFVSLANYSEDVTLSPADWLEGIWSKTYQRGLPSLRDALANGRVLLLLDGFNEIGSAIAMEKWSRFITSDIVCYPGNRVLVTCRRFDYSIPLALDDRYIPHLRITPMDPEKIEHFLVQSDSDIAPELWNAIRSDTNLLSFYGVPLFLKILVDTVHNPKAVALSPAALFARLVWQLLWRELAKNPGLFSDPVLSSLDRKRIAVSRTFSKVLPLPEDGYLIPFLTRLAFRMPGRGGMPLTEARAIMSDQPASTFDDVLTAACAASILNLDFEELTLTFHHQLFQEFFAARNVAENFDDEQWTLGWRVGEIAPFQPTSLHDPLPTLPSSGWEEATIMAMAFSTNQDTFVLRVFAKNPLLAARCAASRDASLSAGLVDNIQTRLVVMMRDPGADLRARLLAGTLLDDLTKLGYEDRDTHLVPPMVGLGNDRFPIGACIDDHDGGRFHASRLTLPEQDTYVEPFQMSAFHVTNAEYAHFIRAGGYQNEEWWESKEARRWLSGESLFDDLRWQLQYDIDSHRKWSQEYIKDQIGLRWSEREAKHLLDRLSWTPRQCDEWILQKVKGIGRPTAPGHWWDSAFNAKTQPVVGVSWFEANAYCRWLSSVTKKSYRLLTEVEYEAAARGKEGRAYAYGDAFDPQKCNVYASRIWRPSPVGLYEGCGSVYDLTGNVWTWTSDVDLETDGIARTRAVRGGSYDTSPFLAQAFCRDSNHASYRDQYVGFRLAQDV